MLVDFRSLVLQGEVNFTISKRRAAFAALLAALPD
jgi:hypothetical protein